MPDVLTDKNLMDKSTDLMISAMVHHFRIAKFLPSLDPNVAYEARHFYGCEKVPKNARIVDFPKEIVELDHLIGIVSDDPHEEALVRKFKPDLDRKTSLVLVNMPLSLEEVSRVYSNAMVIGYAESSEETQRLRQAGGIENAVFLGPIPRDLRNCLRFSYQDLGRLDFKGVLTEDKVDSLIAQNSREGLLSWPVNDDTCMFCDPARHYASVQAQILGIQSQKELTGEFPEERIEVLYRHDPLITKVKSLRELPILGKIGPTCYQTYFFTHECLGRLILHKRMCGGKYKHTEPSVRKFKQEYRTLQQKYKARRRKK